MIRLLTAVSLLTCSLFGWASVYPDNYGGVPHPNFKQGDVIDHEKFNANNLSIKNAINANKAALPPANCSTDQIIKWDDTSDEWKCAEDSLNLVCAVGDTIRATASGWQCESVYDRIVAFARTDNWQWDALAPAPVSALFQSVSNFGSNSECYSQGATVACNFYVTSLPLGFLNLDSCLVGTSGMALGDNPSINKFENRISVSNIPAPASYSGSRFVVNLFCESP